MPHDVQAHDALPDGLDELPSPRVRLYLQLRGDPDEHEWAVRSFVLDERLHAPYALAVTALGPLPKAGIEGLLGGRVVLELARGIHGRTVHGIVLEAELVRGVEGSEVEPMVELHVVPAFALLGLSRRSRMFQGQCVVEIALAVMGPVLAEHGGLVCVDRLRRLHPPRDFCVQYRETDLDFVLRILADDGITVLFDHDAGTETVVLVDANEVLPNAGREPLEDDDRSPPRIPFVGQDVDELPFEGIAALGRQSRLRRRKWTATAWDWQVPGMSVRSETSTIDPAAVGEWWEANEGRFDEAAAAEGLAADRMGRRVQLQRGRDHATATRLRACSNVIGLRVGSVFELLEGPDDELGDQWVVTAVRHEARAEGPRELGGEAIARAEDLRALADDTSEADGLPFMYGNDLECQPLRAHVVPPRLTKPRAVGMQSAVVTGPPGEAIHTDRFGRVRVRMLWDEQEHEGEPTSCWLRVATPWAGDDFGAVFIPRVGTEVLVSFIAGDPDRPICCACVHDGVAGPPYELPGHATRTVLRTRTIAGEGFNELSFEDLAGAEEVFLHAQRNLREQVLAHHCTEVGRNQTLAVEGSRIARIGKDDTTITAGEHRHIVSGKATARFRGGYAVHVGEVATPAESASAPMDTEPEAPAGGFELRSVEPIVFCCGSSRLELRPNGIVLRAPRISVECPSAALVLEQDAATLRAATKIELGTDMLVAVTASMAVLKGPTTEIETIKGDEIDVESASRIDVRGRRVGIEANESIDLAATSRIGVRSRDVGVEADERIEIVTEGEVKIRGTEKIELN
ncbi:type VI secretion system Vgr family protein [Paraliomyxa miuraensis]|uniref:type VI secretion system Vgr family protein n=2 Tax=Paraliomyxa miuraensis TaxID=376150 RepID=UPI002250CCAB|nr:type VI secretion system tip protein TssI/VgrG [Paraliomyxa miuraensis]MCX4248122.1 type VI secretion system tip protein VgrG [Paraliomyxa miuraensis]